jgi:Phage tail tube protein
MGYSSQAGQVLLRTQPTPGVLAADLGAAGVAMKIRSGSLAPSRELMIPDAEIGGGRDTSDAYLGGVSWSGDYEFYARMRSLSTLFRAGFGAVATAAEGTGAATHTFTPSDAAQLPFLSIEEAIGDGLETFNYTDAVVNTLHLEAEPSGYLSGTVGVIARTQVAAAPRTPDPDWDNGAMMVGTNILVTYNGVTVPAKSFSFDLNNNFADDDYRLGSFYIGDLTPAGREVTAGFSIRESSSAMWRQAVYGTPGATAPGGLTTKAPLVITAQTYEMIQGADPVVTERLQLTLPSFALTPYSLDASGADIIESDLEGQALRPNPATPICTATIRTAAGDIA